MPPFANYSGVMINPLCGSNHPSFDKFSWSQRLKFEAIDVWLYYDTLFPYSACRHMKHYQQNGMLAQRT